jgi:polyhydroxybutyrate depolymerase
VVTCRAGAALLALLIGASAGAPARASCLTSTLTPGDHSFSLSVSGRTRTFLVHVPPSYSKLRATPLVVDIHGYTGNASQHRGVSGFRELSDQAGFIAVWPQGVSDSWNAYGCCGNADSSNVDDVGFMRALVNDLKNRANIDNTRVFVTGHSNGGSMTHQLHCVAADVFAAGAAVAFPLNISASSCSPSRPMSSLHFAAKSDSLVPYNGGGFIGAQSASTSFTARKTVAGCSGSPITTQTFPNGDKCDTYNTCSGGVKVTMCSISSSHYMYDEQNVVEIAPFVWNTLFSQSRMPLPDTDADGVADQDDNCPALANGNQADADGDCMGDVCDGGGSPPPPPPPDGGTCTAGNTGWLNPTAQAADSGGDGNGFESNPTMAMADGGSNMASNMNGGGDRHRFYNYGVAIPAGCSVKGIEVRLDWRVENTLFVSSSMGVDLSANGGSSWSSAKTDSNDTTSEHSVTLGSASDLWGSSAFNATSMGNGTFRVRVTANGDPSQRDFYLDWVPVRVTYGP